ncbi:electron transfer flavoprotein subunit alpha/FixB family protein [Paraburkholderia sp. Ac-20342]|uniref:electron transfer flavoprotein subunit alpha/FixB family protein n=1 Tax=Paraburkholderia sp. Ac-20342 TaxID=2703889 RepID=UPI00197DC25C|nr:FAD-binding protein [Paraburkholderia sp. Ac-20342]MBN3849297.1 electron transfer flavoprotein subunit alpha/FixB family protein [Paraburkholderia sp. Ac-20342]
MRTLVIAEADGDRLADAVLRIVTAAAQRGLPVDMLVPDTNLAAHAAQVAGISRVLVAPGVADPTPETLALRLAALAPGYSLIAAAHRTLGRGALPRAAARAGGAFLSDLTAVAGANQFVRGLYAGSVLSTVTATAAITFATFRASSWPAAHAVDAKEATAETVALPALDSFAKTRLIARHTAAQSGQDLSSARVVVSGGRGLGSKDNMERLERFATRIGAALGASRAAVDAGYVSNAAQVGQTGKIVAPDVYFAFGISGAIQHLAGMKDSKTIVAINKDADAPIFSVADIGLVGDLFEVLGELERHAGAAR